MRAASIALSLSLVLLGCSSASVSSPDPQPRESSPAASPSSRVEPSPSPGEDALVDPRFTDTLLSAASKYQSWGRVDERPNLAPVLCRAPMGLDFGFPSHARLSGADEAQHGKKLYYLYAGHGEHNAQREYAALGTPRAGPIPIGFAIVKQSWVAVPSSSPPPNAQPELAPGMELAPFDSPPPITWVDHEGQRLQTGEQAELFVMVKVGEAELPGTDAGWVYGTLTPDGRTVTSAGRVQSCMDCHEAATHERLFGLQKTKAFAKIKPSPWDGEAAPELPPELGLLSDGEP